MNIQATRVLFFALIVLVTVLSLLLIHTETGDSPLSGFAERELESYFS